MNIRIRYFASVREALGTSDETLAVPGHVRTVGDVRAFLRERGGIWSEALGEGRALRMAYDQEMTDAHTTVADGGEVAFFPPVTGG